MDYLASRGEFLNAKLMAEYLGYQFRTLMVISSASGNGDGGYGEIEQNFKEIFDGI